MSGKYQNLNSTDLVESHDDILKEWSDDRKNIAKLIRNNFEENNIWFNIVPYDKYCQSCLDKKIPPFIKNKSCVGCYCMSIVYVNGKINSKIFTLKNKNYHIQTKIGVLDKYKNTKLSNIFGRKISNRLIETCQSGFINLISETKFLKSTSNSITQYILTSCFLINEFNKINIPCLPSFTWVFQCNNEINYIDEILLDEIPFNEINNNSKIVTGIIEQLLSISHFLSRYYFIHGNPNHQYLKFERKPCNYKYFDKVITCPITLRYIPSIYSSFSSVRLTPIKSDTSKNEEEKWSSSNIRLFYSNKTINSDMDSRIMKRIEISSIIDNRSGIYYNENCNCRNKSKKFNPMIEDYTKMKYTTYRLGDAYQTYVTYIRDLGIPLFSGSYDLYSFLTTLMLNTKFKDIVMNDFKLSKLWENIWTQIDYENVKIIMDQNHDKKQFEMKNFLSDKNLRCDVVNFCWFVYTQ